MEEMVNQPDSGVEEEVVEQEEILEDAEGEELEEEQSEPEEENEEIEHDGKKFKIPKELKESFLRQADYTRKTQELAELRRAVEAEKAQVTQTNQAVLQGRARLMAVDEALQQYSKVDWDQYQAQDPQGAQSAFIKYTQLKDTRQQLAGDLYAFEQRSALEQQQAHAKLLEEGAATLQREIPGWGIELQGKLRDFAKDFGYSKEELAAVADPRAIKLLHAAWLAREVQKKPQTKPQKQEVKPVPQVGTGSAKVGRKDPSKMSDAEFAAWRREQIKKRK